MTDEVRVLHRAEVTSNWNKRASNVCSPISIFPNSNNEEERAFFKEGKELRADLNKGIQIHKDANNPNQANKQGIGHSSYCSKQVTQKNKS
uniref:Uncharacterized protein n=1 Tax=Solanum lycopersicum TaxID=4081 RepID=A0A3Q7IFL8_SOLLC